MDNKNKKRSAQKIMELPIEKREEALNKSIQNDINDSINTTSGLIETLKDGNNKFNETNNDFLDFCDNALKHAAEVSNKNNISEEEKKTLSEERKTIYRMAEKNQKRTQKYNGEHQKDLIKMATILGMTGIISTIVIRIIDKILNR